MHRIRLGPPWEVTTADGRTRLARRFGRPRTLDPGERVWLVLGPLAAQAEVTLNGKPVGSDSEAGRPFAADITHLLRPRNQLVIESPSAPPLDQVALEIRAA